MIRSKNLVSVLMIVGAVGCVSQQEDTDTTIQMNRTVNSFSSDSFDQSSPMLVTLGSDKLLVGNVINLTVTQLSEDDKAMLEYSIRCALGPSDVVELTVSGVTHYFQGSLDLAPEWKHNPLSDTGKQEFISSCLLSHVNEYHVPVHLSLRAQGLSSTQDELTRFVAWEGAFYGNLFVPAQPKYACLGDAAPDFSVSYPNHDLTAGDRLLRRCTDVAGPVGNQTLCGFEYVGACSVVCDTQTADGYAGCWSDAAKTEDKYGAPINVWNLPYDDLESTWSDYYDLIYGP